MAHSEDLQSTIEELNGETPSDLDDKERTTISDDIPQSETTTKKRRGPFKVAKRSDTPIKCPACEFRSNNAHTWFCHLSKTHRTTPHLAGVSLRCECGHECFSGEHSKKCTLANYTVIRKRDGPILTKDDAKTTPKCVLCETYPRSIVGYVDHLSVHHQSSLLINEVYLKCSCEFEMRTHNYDTTHTKRCRGREFTLRKLDGENKKKTIENEEVVEEGRSNEIGRRKKKKSVPSAVDNSVEENRKLEKIHKAICEIFEGEKGFRVLFLTTFRRIQEIVSIDTPRSQWKILMKRFDESAQRLKKDENMKVGEKEYRELSRRLAKGIIITQVFENTLSIAEENSKEEYGKVEDRNLTELELEVNKGIRALHSTYRRIRKFTSVETPLSLWKTLLRKFVKSEEELEEGDEFLDQIYPSIQDINENMEARKKNYRKLTRRLARRIIRAAVFDFFKTLNL